ncbi:MAG: hypothetical protein ACE14V_08030 [bacterium]
MKENRGVYGIGRTNSVYTPVPLNGLNFPEGYQVKTKYGCLWKKIVLQAIE